MKHAKHATLRSAPSTPFYGADQSRQFFEARQACHFIRHAGRVRFLGHAVGAISWGRQARGARGARGGAGALFGRLELRSYVLSRLTIHVATPFTF